MPYYSKLSGSRVCSLVVMDNTVNGLSRERCMDDEVRS
jgi:hypothetical protein